MALSLNIPQARFMASQKKFRAFVGGFRSGKTFVGCARKWTLASAHPKIGLGYFAPTYQMIGDIFYPSIAEVAEAYSDLIKCKCKADILYSKKLVTLKIGGRPYANIMCRSMDQPESIIGFAINHAMIDEIDTLKIDKAEKAWNKIIARLSKLHPTYKENTADFTTTPEGYGWIYDFFVKRAASDPKIANKYELIRAPTTENAINLPDDYIQSLYDTYPANLVNAYVKGLFTNLESGAIYADFDRFFNESYETIKGNEPLYIGMDFNVQNMSGVVHVKRNKEAHAVDEIIGGLDTPSMIGSIKERYPDNRIFVYPDASGTGRSTSNASITDISQLKSAGFGVRAKPANPRVKDRVNSVNAAICNSVGTRRYFVNVSKCPNTVENLEQQVYNKSGEPDKAGGKDHTNDALGYFLAYDYPIKKPMQKLKLRSAI